MRDQQGASERVSGSAASTRHTGSSREASPQRWHLEFPVSPGSLPQHLSSVPEQMPAKDSDEGRAHESGAAPTSETVIVSDEDYKPRRHRGPVDDIKCSDGVIDRCPRQVITCSFLWSMSKTIIRLGTPCSYGTCPLDGGGGIPPSTLDSGPAVIAPEVVYGFRSD